MLAWCRRVRPNPAPLHRLPLVCCLWRRSQPLPGRPISSKSIRLTFVLLALAVAGVVWLGYARGQRSEEPIGLFGSIPLMWDEGSDLTLGAPAPWPRAVIERHGKPVPLDSLAPQGGRDPLAGVRRLLLAQPRALSGPENVALDAWVRGGGQLLLLADPMYTGHSRHALGDPRRPQAIAMLSPILTRWGLRLEFDPDQPPGKRQATALGAALPVDMPGRFTLSNTQSCRLWDEGLVATCAIGKGRLLAIADASVLDPEDPSGDHAAAFSALLDAAFAAR